MIDQVEQFEPDWASPPGDSILDLAEERGWSQSELASRLGYTEKHLSLLINGKASLTTDAASRLARVLGSTVTFWLSLEANFQNHLARLKSLESNASWTDWLSDLPVKELMDCDAIDKRRLTNTNKPSIVDDCLRFFGVATPREWRECYGELQMSFRRTKENQSDIGAIASWLRLGEKEAEKIFLPKYAKGNFEQALKQIRDMTCEAPEIFYPKMTELLNQAGVVFAIVPSIRRSHVSGVARWLSPTRPLIQLSLYGKTNDKFWFTFFHEAAHILLHAENRQQKQTIFLDDPTQAENDDSEENEANHWAGNFLIPPDYDHALTSLTTKSQVIAFAKHIKIHPGIVVGRLQHDGIIDPSWMNDLKYSFQIA